MGSFYNIYDYAGKLVLTGKMTSEKIIIGLDNLVAGIYFLNVGANQKQTHKIIKE